MPDFGIFRGFNEKLFGDKLVAGQLPTQLGLIGSLAITFDQDYQAILDYADTQGYTLPSQSQQELQNQLVVDLKDAGVWSKLDILYVFATDGDSDFASINWKDPNNHEITEVNSPTFTTNKGFESIGASAYLDTNWNLATDSVNYSQNDVGLIFGISQLTSITDARPFGSSVTNNYLSYRPNPGRTWVNSSSQFAVTLFATSINNQIMFVNRTGASNVNGRVTDLETPSTNTYSGSTGSQSIPSENMYVLRSATGYWNSGNICSLFGLGSNLSTSEMGDVETAYYTNYFTSL